MSLIFTVDESTSVKGIVGATKQQAFTWANVDAYLDQNELTFCL